MLLTFAAIVSLGCRQEPTAAPELPPPSVQVSHPLQYPIVEYHDHVGQTAAVETVTVRARVRGFLAKVHFQEGADVKKGDLLYEIEPQSFQAEVRRSQAEVDRLKAQLSLTRTEEKRAARLRPTMAISEEEYMQRVAAREQAEASLEQAEAALDVAELELSYTRITAPINGRVGRTAMTEGNLVGFNEPTTLTTIVSMNPIHVYFDVSERAVLEYQRRIREEGLTSASQGTLPVQVGLETEEDYPHAGFIDFRESQVDPQTGTMLIRGVLPNDDRIMNPGMFARVRIPIGQPRNQLLVPQVALGSDQRGDFVLVVTADNTVEYRPVTTGQRIADLVVIQKGVNTNDLVITNGLQKARPGAQVAQRVQPISIPEELQVANRSSDGVR